jgi:hypothetical protein
MSLHPPLPLAALAAAPRWPAERTRALPGRVRGDALRQWGVHLRRRFGDHAPDAVRARLGVSLDELPDAPGRHCWVPLPLQVRLLQVITDELLDGDALRMDTLFSDSTSAADHALSLAGRIAGPGLVLRMAGGWHASVCDVGRCEAEVDGPRATLRFTGAEAFDDPSWRLSQALGVGSIFTSLRRPATRLEGASEAARSFALLLAW